MVKRLATAPPTAYPAHVPLVIDTYNVLHVTGVLPGELAVGTPEELAALIAASRFAHDATWLMCDGVPRGASRVGRIVIEGSGRGRKADDHIADFLTKSSAPRSVTVVSSDREVGRRARARGAQWLRSEDFLTMLAEDARRLRPRKPSPASPRRSVPLNDREIAGWMTLFEITAEMVEIQAAPGRAHTGDGAARGKDADRRVHSATSDAALERYIEATKDLDDPLSILDGREGQQLLAALGNIDDAALDALMKAHEPPVLKDGARIGARNRVRKRAPGNTGDAGGA